MGAVYPDEIEIEKIERDKFWGVRSMSKLDSVSIVLYNLGHPRYYTTLIKTINHLKCRSAADISHTESIFPMGEVMKLGSILGIASLEAQDPEAQSAE